MALSNPTGQSIENLPSTEIFITIVLRTLTQDSACPSACEFLEPEGMNSVVAVENFNHFIFVLGSIVSHKDLWCSIKRKQAAKKVQ